METPLSTRRVTRSQTVAASNNNKIPTSRKIEESEKGVSKSRQPNGKQQDRSALIDITNDSPIVGLAMESLETPSSAMSKKRNGGQAKHSNTPGSGEALLRGQVKTLLQKVEEEAELSKLSLDHRPFLHLVNSPMGLLAPTPANTPHVSNLSISEESFKNNCLASVTPSPVQEQLTISQMVTEMFDGKKQEGLESEKSLITRSLLLDFSEKSVGSASSECSSVLTHKGGVGGESESDASVWSIQVNASARDDEEEEGCIEGIGKEENEDYDEGEEEEGEEGLLDELCEGISKISVNGEMTMVKFTGKHTRFVYNSDDECGGESEAASSSPQAQGILRLKGLPTPKGKHLRFPEEEEN
uniref:Chalcone-flavanone isomerase family protein n=1 Tax=Davidia involucrata TaxID=16924 RepID=A0A5B6YT92_DAVIN